MRVLVTGGSGFIGKKLVQQLISNGFKVLAIGRSIPTGKDLVNLHTEQADLSQPKSYIKIIEDFLPELVIHLAWQDIPDFSYEKSYLNLSATITFLDFVTNMESCKKIVVAGSCWEFDNLLKECSDSEVGIPTDYFTWAKHAIRTWLELRCKEKDITYVWFRIFYVYGHGQRENALLPYLIKTFKRNQVPLIKNPFNANDFIFVDDVVRAFVLASSKDLVSGIYNLGSGYSTSIIDFSREVEQIILGSTHLTNELSNSFNRKKTLKDFWASTTKTKFNLGWEATTTLKKGIAKTYEIERI